MARIAFLQPEVPHYREEFFKMVSERCEVSDIYVYNSFEKTKGQGFNQKTNGLKHIGNVLMKGAILLYNPFPLLSKKYDTLVLMIHFAHITTWILLLTKWLHRKKIILWGQGISVKRYLKEQYEPDWKLKLQIALADGVWTYQEPEAKQWKMIFPEKRIVALNNTLTGVQDMLDYTNTFQTKGFQFKQELKDKYKITQDFLFIFCARFESNYRRTDLLLESIRRLNPSKYGFIIIGAGRNKPDFSMYDNVYDFGVVYDTNVKRELFSIADAYYQPGWVGLSIVEAMAYGKPIFTFERSHETFQCVEYCYIENNVNGLVFQDINDFVNRITSLSADDISSMSKKSLILVKTQLLPESMVGNAMSIFEHLK